jgi:hypothetical protein
MGFARHESTACGPVNPPAPEFGAVHCSGPGAGSRRCWGSDEMRCLPLGLAAWRTRRAACPTARRSGVVGEPPRTRLAERTTDPDGEVATLRALLDELELERGRSSAARVGATWLRILALVYDPFCWLGGPVHRRRPRRRTPRDRVRAQPGWAVAVHRDHQVRHNPPA